MESARPTYGPSVNLPIFGTRNLGNKKPYIKCKINWNQYQSFQGHISMSFRILFLLPSAGQHRLYFDFKTTSIVVFLEAKVARGQIKDDWKWTEMYVPTLGRTITG